MFAPLNAAALSFLAVKIGNGANRKVLPNVKVKRVAAVVGLVPVVRFISPDMSVLFVDKVIVGLVPAPAPAAIEGVVV